MMATTDENIPKILTYFFIRYIHVKLIWNVAWAWTDLGRKIVLLTRTWRDLKRKTENVEQSETGPSGGNRAARVQSKPGCPSSGSGRGEQWLRISSRTQLPLGHCARGHDAFWSRGWYLMKECVRERRCKPFRFRFGCSDYWMGLARNWNHLKMTCADGVGPPLQLTALRSFTVG